MEQQKQQRDGDGGAAEADIERLPADLLAHVLSLLPTFRDLSMYGKAPLDRFLSPTDSCCSASLCFLADGPCQS